MTHWHDKDGSNPARVSNPNRVIFINERMINNQMQQDINLIEKNIKVLEKRYTDFCEGVISLEPKALRAQTDALVRKWWGKPVANTQMRFKLHNLVQRYNSYKEKWGRELRLKARREKEDEF